MTINFKDWQSNLQEGLKGNQHKLDKNKNGKLDSHDFKLLRKEDIEAMTEEQIDEVLSKDASAGEWIKDFVDSDNPKFAGKSKEKRKQMALAAYYAKQRNEEFDLEEEFDIIEEEEELDEAAWGKDKKANLKAALDRHTEKAVAANKAGDHEAVKVHQSKIGMIKTQMSKLAKEEIEIDEAAKKKPYDKDEVAKKIGSAMNKADDLVQKGRAERAAARAIAMAKYGVKMKKEDVDLDEEQLDELSKKTLGSYVNKAAADVAKNTAQAERRAANAKDSEKRAKDPKLSFASGANKALAAHDQKKSAEYTKKSMKREIGIGKAVSRLTQEGDCDMKKKTFREFMEEVEEIMELDINLLKSMQKDAKKKPMNKDPESERNAHKKYGYRSDDNDDDDDDDDKPKKKPAPTGEKRGRGRPKGSTSSARLKGSSPSKSYGGLPIHSLNLPNTNK